MLRLTLQDDAFAFGESITTLLIVSFDAGQEFVAALRRLDVFNADVDALGEDLSSNALVHDNSDRVFRDVIDSSSLSVVSLEWHSFMDRSISLKISNEKCQ